MLDKVKLRGHIIYLIFYVQELKLKLALWKKAVMYKGTHFVYAQIGSTNAAALIKF